LAISAGVNPTETLSSPPDIAAGVDATETLTSHRDVGTKAGLDKRTINP